MTEDRTNFENLRVYQLAEQLADDVWDVVMRWGYFARDTVGKQIVRSADSIGANIAEGSGRGTVPDNRRLVRTARGSLYETKHWLRRCYRRRLLNKEQVDSLRATMRELTLTLNGYLRSLRDRPTESNS
jgi:four helix bundle protein